jgi:hypothetical protein
VCFLDTDTLQYMGSLSSPSFDQLLPTIVLENIHSYGAKIFEFVNYKKIINDVVISVFYALCRAFVWLKY